MKLVWLESAWAWKVAYPPNNSSAPSPVMPTVTFSLANLVSKYAFIKPGSACGSSILENILFIACPTSSAVNKSSLYLDGFDINFLAILLSSNSLSWNPTVNVWMSIPKLL